MAQFMDEDCAEQYRPIHQKHKGKIFRPFLRYGNATHELDNDESEEGHVQVNPNPFDGTAWNWWRIHNHGSERANHGEVSGTIATV